MPAAKGRPRRARLAGALFLTLLLFALSACSISRLAVRILSRSLSSGDSTVFTGDDDPQLVADALPFAMKLYETLLQQDPENANLLLTTGSAFVMYANAFVQTPAGMLPEGQFETQQEMLRRAKAMYLRGRGYLMRAMELRHPGFAAAAEGEGLPAMLEQMDAEDLPFLLWTAASWLGAFSTDPFDMRLLLGAARPVAMLERALALDESYADGMIHDTLISVYGSLPASLGGSPDRARQSFEKAVQFSRGTSASPYVSLATAVAIPRQDPAEFRSLLEQALAVDLEANPGGRLANILSQRKARWLLDHIGDFFLLEEN
jgi:predicted anti-sigma-YlaC factor YlaD